jgi:hypothetical protein
MKAVNSITEFFLKGLRKMQAKQLAEGADTLWVAADKARQAVGDPVSEETEEKMKASIAFGLVASAAALITDAVNGINSAGKVLVRVAMPEQVEAAGGSVDPVKLKADAAAAANRLAAALPLIEAFGQYAAEGVDFEHLVETIFEEGKKAAEAAQKAAAAKTPKAVPVTGTATPLHKRWEPSAN